MIIIVTRSDYSSSQLSFANVTPGNHVPLRRVSYCFISFFALKIHLTAECLFCSPLEELEKQVKFGQNSVGKTKTKKNQTGFTKESLAISMCLQLTKYCQISSCFFSISFFKLTQPLLESPHFIILMGDIISFCRNLGPLES